MTKPLGFDQSVGSIGSQTFSFGALLYEMVTGRRAFQADSQVATLSAILREEPKPAGQIAEGLPRELERIIARCLRKDPARRFQAMPDLKIALEELKEESDSGKLGVATAPQRQRRWLTWAIALMVLGGMVSTLWFARSTPIDLCINNAIIGVQEQNTYAQTEG